MLGDEKYIKKKRKGVLLEGGVENFQVDIYMKISVRKCRSHQQRLLHLLGDKFQGRM